MILIYSKENTNRLKYIFNFIFQDILGAKIKFTNSTNDFKVWESTKISYAEAPIDDELFFQSTFLLLSRGVKEPDIKTFSYKGEKVFFETQHDQSAFPFDPFAAAFFLISRYEEYLPHVRDQYDRFEANDSLAFKEGFLKKPLVDTWAYWIRKKVHEHYPEVAFTKRKYQFIPSIDIDNAFAFIEKGFVRTIGGYIKSLMKLDFEEVAIRTKVLLGKMKDPYDTYDFQVDLIKRYQLKCIYFFLLGDYGINDKNVPVESLALQSLIKSIGDYAEVGIHPSFGSNDNREQIKKEIRRLSNILNKEVSKSRQHFLKLRIPETYRALLDLDISHDYTMGYASSVGFRASTCSNFHFYDLDTEQETKLLIHPFAVMEGTLKFYMKIKPEDAMDEISPLIDEVKKVNGTFMTLWHNETLNDYRDWKGWKVVYEEMIKKAIS